MHKEWLAAAAAWVVTTDRKVPRVRLPGRVLLLGVALLAGPVSTLRAESVTELIEQARQCDPSYTIGPQVSRSQAMESYEKALTAGITDQQQQLDVLFRMGQLQGCIFDRRKGEKPHLRKAIGFYQQIVESYPPEEPMVMIAIGLISDHYTTLREFDAALTWAKRAVEYDTTGAEKQLADIHRRVESLADTRYTPQERQAIIHDKVRSAALAQNLRQVKTGQVAAVDRVAFAAEMLDPLQAHGELRAIADRHAGTPVGDRAAQKLREAMDRRPDLWAPHLEEPGNPAATWRPAPGAAGIVTTPKALEEAPALALEIRAGPAAPDPNTTAKPLGLVPLTKVPRAPPRVLLSASLVVAAGLVILGLTARKIRKKTLSRNTPYET